MKLISWNVNGIRAVMKKGFTDVLDELDADFVCIQETKAHPEQIESYTDNYPYQYINSAKRKGYSGTMVLCKKKPLSIKYGINVPEFDDEGRIITLEYPEFYLVTVYTPTSGDGLMRLDYRLEWDEAFGNYLKSLDKPVMACGDFNVANNEIDVPYPDMIRGTAGFSDEERDSFKENLLSNLVDTYRVLNPETIQYSWWSYRGQARENNIGMRLDYWLVSNDLKDKIVDSKILDDIYGSDHCPIMLDINI
ncbi:exodeoxyribonuclease III [Holdemanella biformis]|uniref:Exodeoxyribonuclease III n=1 Tax=Holdemanella biformis DSM 3989 TaxID=518637 RepID=B7CD13_9FIRM|nr:exodeoxyribonuclease III [Holdemanella biformis]EEC89318.1 exodeoxyribonuclease III [Holdemanella biformis DSM 3989]